MTTGEVRERLARRGLLAHRTRGQNFLVQPRVAERIVALAPVGLDETVIEIGTGLGMLTLALAAQARRVVTIEVDAGLVRALREEVALPGNVTLVHADALRLDLRAFAVREGPAVRLVASLPYSVATPLLRAFLDARDVLLGWAVVVQREVAERLLAPPGSKAYGSLAVLHRLTTRVERALDLAPRCFYPVPRVASTLVRVTPRASSPLAGGELPWVERVVRAAFGRRRKMLANALREGLREAPAPEAMHGILEALRIDRRARAESLAPEQLLALARALGESAAR